jgi:hypothetical protein
MPERKQTLADQIRLYALQKAAGAGVSPAAVIGMIEETSGFAPGRQDGDRIGLMGVPRSALKDPAAYMADWQQQVDVGVGLLAAAKAGPGLGTDLGAVASFMGGDDRAKAKAVRAYARGAKYTNEPMNTWVIGEAHKALGVAGDPEADLRAAGIPLAAQRMDRAQLHAMAKTVAPGLEHVVDAISGIESGHGSSKTSYVPRPGKPGEGSTGIVGPLQIMSKQLGSQFGNFEANAAPGMTNPLNPAHSAAAGMRMLANLVRKNKGDPERAAMEYFTGVPNPPASASDGLSTASEYLRKFRAGMQIAARDLGTSPGIPAARQAALADQQVADGTDAQVADGTAPQAGDDSQQTAQSNAASDADYKALTDALEAEFASSDAQRKRAASIDERVASAFGGIRKSKTTPFGQGIDEMLAALVEEDDGGNRHSEVSATDVLTGEDA